MRLLVVLMLVPAVASAEPMGWWVSGGAIGAVPRGDLVYESNTWGVSLAGGKHVVPHWGVVGGFRSMSVPTTREDCNARYTLHDTRFVIGARYSHELATRLTGFVDGELHLVFFKVDHLDFASSSTRPTLGGGIGLRAGLLVQIADHVLAGAALGGSAAKLDLPTNFGPEISGDFAVRWLTADAFVAVAF